MISTLITGESYQISSGEITWAGECPWNGSHCFGTESGTVVYKPVDGLHVDDSEFQAAEDAINGVAFWQNLIGVSTRGQVSICKPNPANDNVEFISVEPRGAYGIVATPRGCFLAPMGTEGLYCFDAEQGPEGRPWIERPARGAFNFYKLMYLGRSDSKEILVCAARNDGLFTILFDKSAPHSDIVQLTSPHIDLIDVCSIGTPELPFAAVGLGVDRSLTFVRDVLLEEKPQTLRLDDLSGTPYAILSARGHLFVLTSKELVVVPNLISRYLNREELDRPFQYRSTAIQAVDAYITYDRDLLIIVDEGVKVLDIDRIIRAAVDETTTSSSGELLPWRKTEESPSLVSPDWKVIRVA